MGKVNIVQKDQCGNTISHGGTEKMRENTKAKVSHRTHGKNRI